MNTKLSHQFLKRCFIQGTNKQLYLSILPPVLQQRFFFCSKKYRPLRRLSQEITTIYIDKSLSNGVLTTNKKWIVVYLPSLGMFVNNYIMGWSVLTSLAFSASLLLGVLGTYTHSGIQALNILVLQIQLTPQGSLKRFYLTIKRNRISNMITNTKKPTEIRIPDQMSWLNPLPQKKEKKIQKWVSNQKLKNPLTGKKAYPNPQNQQQLYAKTIKLNSYFTQKMKITMIRFPVEVSDIQAIKFFKKDIQIPKNTKDLKELMKKLQNETIQIDIKCRFVSSKFFFLGRQIQQCTFLAPLTLNGDPKFEQILIALALGLEIQFK